MKTRMKMKTKYKILVLKIYEDNVMMFSLNKTNLDNNVKTVHLCGLTCAQTA